jgi:hypothetical protein
LIGPSVRGIDTAQEVTAMKPEVRRYSFEQRAAEKAAARAKDEAALKSGVVAPAKMAHVSGGSVRDVRRIGPAARMRRIAET